MTLSALNFAPAVRGLCLSALLTSASGVTMANAVFHAVVSGQSQIVEVINPAGPVVRVQTAATGSGTPGLLSYFSGDVIDLATGQGSGSNRFLTASGDEIFGSFTVQMVPGADSSLFQLIGDMNFTGGTGEFLGASGTGSFLGSGQFVSASLALTNFEFQGNIATVPEPASWMLFGLGLAIGTTRLWGRRAGGSRALRPAA